MILRSLSSLIGSMNQVAAVFPKAAILLLMVFSYLLLQLLGVFCALSLFCCVV